MQRYSLAVLGASSLVGQSIIQQWCKQSDLNQAKPHQSSIKNPNPKLLAFSRTPLDSTNLVDWCSPRTSHAPQFDQLICVAPIWTLLDYFNLLQTSGCKRLVVLSSTSRYSKQDSWFAQDQTLADRLAKAEASVIAFATTHQIDWLILRPTLIYGYGRDQNISKIALMIKRLGFFVLTDRAPGLRQPVHCEDVACACLDSMKKVTLKQMDYNISGGETLSYYTMVVRIFTALKRPVRIVSVPGKLLSILASIFRLTQGKPLALLAIMLRMNEDLVFTHEKAARDFNYKPRSFSLSLDDLP